MRQVIALQKIERDKLTTLANNLYRLREQYKDIADKITVAESEFESQHKYLAERYGIRMNDVEVSYDCKYLIGYSDPNLNRPVKI